MAEHDDQGYVQLLHAVFHGAKNQRVSQIAGNAKDEEVAESLVALERHCPHSAPQAPPGKIGGPREAR